MFPKRTKEDCEDALAATDGESNGASLSHCLSTDTLPNRLPKTNETLTCIRIGSVVNTNRAIVDYM